MKKNLLFAVSISVCGLLFSGLVLAQEDKVVSAAGDMYVISAKAGGVNHVEGNVSISRKDGKSEPLLKSDKIEIGDKVSTGADGKTEILLNPGSFVRLGANAEFEFISTDLNDLRLKLLSGSAIFEVYADSEFKVTLDLPDAELVLTKSGVYRIDVLADGSGRISVWKGKFVMDEEEVTAGRRVIVKGNSLMNFAKFDRDVKDALDLWSDLRAKEASKINKRLRRDALTQALLGSYNNGAWNMWGTFGVWVFDSFSRRWCFLPFGQGWRSPYGYGYGFNIYNCPLPPIVYAPPVTTTNPTAPGTQMTPAQAQIREERRQRMQTPTFQRFENNQREERGGGRGSDDGNTGTTGNGGGWNNSRDRSETSSPGNSSPTYTPAPMPSAPSNPAPAAPIITPPTRGKDQKID
jgi:hypothetical protein